MSTVHYRDVAESPRSARQIIDDLKVKKMPKGSGWPVGDVNIRAIVSDVAGCLAEWPHDAAEPFWTEQAVDAMEHASEIGLGVWLLSSDRDRKLTSLVESLREKVGMGTVVYVIRGAGGKFKAEMVKELKVRGYGVLALGGGTADREMVKRADVGLWGGTPGAVTLGAPKGVYAIQGSPAVALRNILVGRWSFYA